MGSICLFLIFLLSFNSTPNKQDKIVMPTIFSDNMVLQQNSSVPFWGKADPNANVRVAASWGQTAETKVLSDGHWQVKLKTTKAGGPYQVKVEIGDSTIVYKNVMLGEVWLCSGQSNMEMPLEGWPQTPVKNSALEIETANYPNIRLFTVNRAVSNKPEFNCVGSWSECSPKTAAKFSATAYFFGRKLYRELNVPIGLIFTSWGGTKVQSWISGKYLGKLPEYNPIVEKIDSSGPAITKLNNWIHSHRVIDISEKKPEDQYKNLNFDDNVCSQPKFDDSAWKEMKLPTYWEATKVGDFNGAVWFRKKINVPTDWINHNLVLKLGPIDDMDETFVNGIKVGGLEEVGYYATPRVYDVPANVVNDSLLSIAVRVIDNGGGGGLWGTPDQMKIYQKADSNKAIALSGEWKYLPVAEYINNKFYVYGYKSEEFYSRPKTPVDVSAYTPTMLYNGMIAPVIPYHIKGVIWYQGESNSDLPQDYNSYHILFPLMIKNWRADWKEDNFPFYYVQIAPFTYGENSKSQVVRYAQFQTLSVPNTGMAVTLDIGNLTTIHPPDKQDVGKRLALWALAKNYHKNVFYSGPLYKSMKIENGKIILSFKDADGGLVLKDIKGKTNPPSTSVRRTGFIIAGKDQKFFDASAKVEGNKLVVYSEKVKKPVAARYAWSNEAEATLFNKEGLPASTFKTDDWSDK